MLRHELPHTPDIISIKGSGTSCTVIYEVIAVVSYEMGCTLIYEVIAVVIYESSCTLIYEVIAVVIYGSSCTMIYEAINTVSLIHESREGSPHIRPGIDNTALTAVSFTHGWS